MIYQATLDVGGIKRNITNYSYRCHVPFSDSMNLAKLIYVYNDIKRKGLPVEGDLITLTFQSTDDDQFFYDWFLVGIMRDGEIVFTHNIIEVDDVFRFWDCYCVGVEERMGVGDSPMSLTVYLSPGIIKRSNLPAREKVWKISNINAPTVTNNPETTVENKTQTVTPLVTAVQGSKYALPGDTIRYNVTNYNISNIKATDRDQVKWIISVEGEKELLNEHGNTLNLLIYGAQNEAYKTIY